LNKNRFEDLDFGEFIKFLSDFASTIYGKRLITTSEPVFEPERLAYNLDLNRELFHFLKASELNLEPVEDIIPVIEKSKNQALSPNEIQLIINFQHAIESIRIDVDEKYEKARQFLERLKPIKTLEILDKTIKDGKIRHNATDALFSIISKIENLRQSIYQKQRALLRSLKQSDITTSDEILIRQDRYCIAIKAAKRHLVKGMLIDVSGSGASVFIDPEQTIELNNLLVMQRAKEKEEKLKILHNLTAKISHNSGKLLDLANRFGTLDKINAFHRYAIKYNCMLAEYKPETKGFFLKNARHPMLISLKNDVVANDIKQIDKTGMIISGPNAGGKTVLLKTIGLSILAFYCSIPIPSEEGSWIGRYDRIFAIFGNKENMAESLSNFSSKLIALKDIFENATSRSLALIDEITEGTEPEAGGNLAIAIFKSLTKKGISFVCSTHLTRVPLWALAESEDSIEIAGASFDKNTLMPTYKLEYGKIAESHTLDIASRFLPGSIVSSAENGDQTESKFMRQLIDEIGIYKKKTAKLQKIIKKKQQEAKALSEERMRLAKEQEEISRQKAKEISHIIKEAEQKIRSLKSVPDLHREISKLKQENRQKIDKRVNSQKFLIGETVNIKGTSIQGEIGEVKQDKIKIISSGKEVWIDKKEACRVQGRKKPVSNLKINYQETDYQLSCNLIGMHIDEAREKLIRFLDNAILNGADSVVIIHGIGTGALKNMTVELLRESDFIGEIRVGKPKEGGSGVTIAKFK